MPVDRVTIHHQGGGAPTDDSSGYSHGGYTYGIGATRWERFRSVADSYATLNYNGESLDICLSGCRHPTCGNYPVTDNDLALLGGIIADARARGEVIDSPVVVPHKESPGSSTACPGDRTMDRWHEIVTICTGGAAPGPAPTPPPTGGELLTTIAQPGRTKAGRVATARPCPPFGCILLENGASLHGDQANGNGRVCVSNNSTVIATGHKLIDITPTLDADGKPNGDGVIALYSLGDDDVGTYSLAWS